MHLPSLTWDSLLPVSEILKLKECLRLSGHPVDDHHDVEDDDQEVENLRPCPACTLIDRPCNKFLCATCSLIGRFCCDMICRKTFVLLELLPLALLDLKIGSNDGVQLVSSFGCFLFFHLTKLSQRCRKVCS